MNEHRTELLRNSILFALLVAIGVAGRWGQPQWCFTPTAAAAIFAGWYFSRLAAAIAVPIAILAVSDLLLPAHDSLPVMLITYAVMTLPVWFGRGLRNTQGTWSSAWRWIVCGIMPASLFYVVTNFAVWAFQSDYQKSWAGLVQCYCAAVPFYRWMLAGDLFYLAILFGASALAGLPVASFKQKAPETIKR